MYYNLAKTAEILNLQAGEVNRLREQGKLRAYRDGSDWKFRKEEVDAFLARTIKERSNEKNELLSSGDDSEDETNFAVDSAAFDDMFDKTASEGVKISAKMDDDLQIVAEDEDDGFSIASDESSSVSEESNLSYSLKGDDSALELGDEVRSDGGSSDDLVLAGDSGISLLSGDLGGSSVNLGGVDDMVLSGSGSNDGLSLTGDSGIEIADVDFVTEQDQDELELAPESSTSTPQILNFDAEADTDSPTQLASEEGIFEIETATTDLPESSESMSSSVFTNQVSGSDAPNPFETIEDSHEEGNDGDIFALASSEESTPSPTTESASDSLSGSDPFMTDDSTDASFSASKEPSPFLDPSESSPFPDDSSSGLALDGGGSEFNFGNVGAESSGFGDLGSEPSFQDLESSPLAAPVSSTQYEGKDLLFLVPCLICLILATIGALELCRTIWSYQEGSFDLGGPLLEAIAKMIKLM